MGDSGAEAAHLCDHTRQFLQIGVERLGRMLRHHGHGRMRSFLLGFLLFTFASGLFAAQPKRPVM